MQLPAYFGIGAAACSVLAFVPQAYKIFKTHQTKDLSLPMWILQVIGFALWVTYGATSRNWPIIVPNAICFLLSCFILGMKLMAKD
jgi:MtN3 and saliva related transmembrane protein